MEAQKRNERNDGIHRWINCIRRHVNTYDPKLIVNSVKIYYRGNGDFKKLKAIVAYRSIIHSPRTEQSDK